MGLKEFDDEVWNDEPVMQTQRNVVICIHPDAIEATNKSYINQTLELLHSKLLREMPEHAATYVAYVWGDKVVYAKDFQVLKEEVLYMDYVKKPVMLFQIITMGLALLENKTKKDVQAGVAPEIIINTLYLLTDKVFNQIDNMILSDSVKKRFEDLEVNQKILIKSRRGSTGRLEKEFFTDVYLDEDIQVLWKD